jgi:hypothetical protein
LSRLKFFQRPLRSVETALGLFQIDRQGYCT